MVGCAVAYTTLRICVIPGTALLPDVGCNKWSALHHQMSWWGAAMIVLDNLIALPPSMEVAVACTTLHMNLTSDTRAHGALVSLLLTGSSLQSRSAWDP